MRTTSALHNDQPFRVLIDAATVGLLIEASPGWRVENIERAADNDAYVLIVTAPDKETYLVSTGQAWFDLRNHYPA